MPEEPRYTCPCCGHITFVDPPGSFDICPVCNWEDDFVQLEDPTYEGGANRPSLIQAQRNYREMGDADGIKKKRPRRKYERDPDWRPFDDGDGEPSDGDAAPGDTEAEPRIARIRS